MAVTNLNLFDPFSLLIRIESSPLTPAKGTPMSKTEQATAATQTPAYVSHKVHARPTIIVTAVLAVLLSGCATTTSDTLYKPHSANAPFNTVLIIAVSDDEEKRRDLEELLADFINDGKTKGVSAYTVESPTDHRAREPADIAALLQKTGADALLVIRPVDASVELGKTQQQAYLNIGPQMTIIHDTNVTEVYISGYSIHETDAIDMYTLDTHMEALLTDVADNGRILYRLEVENKFKADGGDTEWSVATEVASAVAKKLRHSGLIR
jgi:hypothetical protein